MPVPILRFARQHKASDSRLQPAAPSCGRAVFLWSSPSASMCLRRSCIISGIRLSRPALGYCAAVLGVPFQSTLVLEGKLLQLLTLGFEFKLQPGDLRFENFAPALQNRFLRLDFVT